MNVDEINGSDHYVPEVFADDPFAIKTPLAAETHCVRGSGGALNLYANDIDISSLKAEDFGNIKDAITSGEVGTFQITDAQGHFDTGEHALPFNLTPAAAVGCVSPVANGVLTTNGKGGYNFLGWIGFHDDYFDLDDQDGRTPLAKLEVTAGRQLHGAGFFTYIVGTVRFNRSSSQHR